jgi:hypothetical protein
MRSFSKFNFFKLSICLGFLFLLVLGNTNNVLTTKKVEFINKLFPQGWSFFTKSPRSSILQLYRLSTMGDADYFEKVNSRNSSLENFLGLSRNSRRIDYESALFLKDNINAEWNDTIIHHIDSFATSLDNYEVNDTICVDSLYYFTSGTYLAIQHEIKPYLYFTCSECRYNYELKYLVVYNNL